MIDIKQLKCFITCADVGSFSEAASVLYTTQSSVSKVIRALEEEMQASLFVRNPHGISLTPNGKQAYAYASRVLENVEAMAELSTAGDTQWLNISFNPSSWMADCFVKFYQLHEKENLQKTSGIAAYHNNAANRNACTAYPGISNREIKQH